jgi:hypothetical protein
MTDNNYYKVNTISELILSFINPTPFILNEIIIINNSFTKINVKPIKAVEAVRAIIRYMASDMKGNDAIVSLLPLVYDPELRASTMFNNMLGTDLSSQWLQDLVYGYANTNAYDNIGQVSNALKEINNNTILDLYLSNNIIHMLLKDLQKNIELEMRDAEVVSISNKFTHRLIMHGRIENTKVIYLKWIDYIIDKSNSNVFKGLLGAQLARFDRLPQFLNPNKESGYYIKFLNNCENGDIVYPNISAELMSTLGFYLSTSDENYMACDYNGTKNQVLYKDDIHNNTIYITKGLIIKEPDIDKSKSSSVLYCCGEINNIDNRYDGRILIKNSMYG